MVAYIGIIRRIRMMLNDGQRPAMTGINIRRTFVVLPASSSVSHVGR
jgi:hypothetical protein